MLLQRVHVWVAGEGKSIHIWGWVWGGAAVNMLSMGVTDGLKFWDWVGRYQAVAL